MCQMPNRLVAAALIGSPLAVEPPCPGAVWVGARERARAAIARAQS